MHPAAATSLKTSWIAIIITSELIAYNCLWLHFRGSGNVVTINSKTDR